MSNFIAEIKRRLPEADWPTVVAALRSEPQVWSALQDVAFAEQALDAAGADRERWSPAFLSLLTLGQTQHFESLRAAPMQPVAEKLRYQAAAAFEKLIQSSSDERIAPDLAEAALLALALRERRRLLNGWDQLAEDMGMSGISEVGKGFWQLTVSILFGLLPNPQELLTYLIAPDQHTEIQQLGIQALVNNPLPLDVQSAHLLELVRNFPLPQFMTLLRSVANVSAPLAQQAATQALEDLQDEGSPHDSALAEIQRLMLEAEVHQIGGQNERADKLLRSAWEASRQLEVELADKLADVKGLDAETIAELQKSVQPVKPAAKSKRPASLLAAAKVAFKSDEIAEAIEMASAALKAVTKESGPADSRKGELLGELSSLFIDLQMQEEALAAAEGAAQAQPNDAVRALQYAKLLQASAQNAEALQQLHLAAALDPRNSEVRRNLAKAQQSNEQYEEAFQEWKAFIDNEADPKVEDWLAFADSGLHSNHFDETIKACQYALALQPTNGAAYALIGSALLAQGDEGSALAHLRRATELAPAQSEAWLALAGLQLARKDPEDALATLAAAQQFIASTAKLQQMFGAVFQALDRLEESLAAYQDAAKLADQQSDAATAQSAALKVSGLQIQLGQREAALQTLETGQRAFPNNSTIAAQLGKLLLSFSEPKRALISLNQALQAEPDNSDLLMDIARAQISVSELTGAAEQTLEILLAQKDAPAEARALIAEAKAGQGKHSDAVKAFDAALKSLSGDKSWTKRLMLGKARSQAASGKPVAAISVLEALEREEPSDLDVQRELCVCYQQAGRGDEAAQFAQKIYLANSQDEETVVWYADLMEALGKSIQACKAISKSSRPENRSPRMILSLANLQWSGESPESAKKTLAQINQLEDGEAASQAGKFLLDRGEAKESIAFFKRAIQLAGLQVDVLENLAGAYVRTEQWADALETLEQAVRLAPHKPEMLEQKSGVLLKLGKPQAALQTIEASLQLLPNNLNLLARKAQILREQEDWAAALDAAGKAFALDTSHPGNLQAAAELAVLNLQPEQARAFFSQATMAAKPNLELASLQAELALDASLEIEAAKHLATAMDESHPRVIAMQARLAACRGDRSQAAQLLQQAIAMRGRQATPNIFTTLGVAKAAEKLNDWQTAISLYEELAKSFPGQAAAKFNLGRAILLRAEWQQLCEASHAKTSDKTNAFSKEARKACEKSLAAAFSAASDAATQAVIKGWQTRTQLRFGSKLDLSALPQNYPASAAEAAALIAAASRTGESAEAEERAKAFITAPEVMVEKAIAKMEDDIAMALQFIQQAAVVLLQSAPVQALAAHIVRRAGELINALPFAQRALALWPEQANWQALAGEIQQALGNLMEAKGHFTIATQLEPEEAKHFFARGKVEVAAHSLSDGIWDLEQASKLEPKRAEYSLALAAAYRTAGDSQHAKSYAQQAQKQAPQDPAALLLQAELALEAGEARSAKDLVQQALKIAPTDSAALLLFAESLNALGETEDAVAVLDRARETADDEVPLLIRRAQLLADSRGLDALVKLSQRYPDRPEVFFALSEALAAAGSTTEAIRAAQRAAKKVGESTSNEQLAAVHLHLGKLLKQSGNLDQSLHHLEQAGRLAPYSAVSHVERGRVFLARRQHKQALQAFQQAAALAPNDATPHFEVGMALKEAKDFNAAEAELRKAARLAPKDRQIQRQLAAVIALNIVHHPVEVGAAL
jgi:tetratricopeptide (TPR) repeat protein